MTTEIINAGVNHKNWTNDQNNFKIKRKMSDQVRISWLNIKINEYEKIDDFCLTLTG